MNSNTKSLTGQRFGKLLVLGYESLKGYKCRCDCGNIYYTKAYYLTHGRISSCGCNKYEHNKHAVHPKRGNTFHTEIINKKFGHLTVIKTAGHKGGHEYLLCQCDCGKTTVVNYYKLTSGHTKSCGSNIHKIKNNIAGRRFGKLVAIRPLSIKGSDGAIWECKCDCGSTVNISAHSLLVGWIKSCGCIKEEISRNKVSGTRLYAVWLSMRDRCNNPKNASYKNYGGRGIVICEEWDDFDSFRAWALDSGYKEGLTIERTDVNKGYNPDNCTWATRKIQASNKRNTLLHTYKGETMTLVKLAEITQLSYDSIHHHYKNGTLDKWLRDKGF